ncbi:hypothetical protein [Streptomyces spirodelae]|uniref:Secreted protein n=1 Tax=Streptomyces spirodelae TaxID=2812904 RepID=A0ABS3WXU7_9ACTN|nr:hypothetical protein [Streptomyces spirodelae]MBO8187899.1 hypothetical protein [Streptomyces spirodelae]
MALLTAAVAALATVLGYLANQYASRRAQRRDLFAEALAAVRAYQDLPYRVRWRARSDAETRAALGELTYTTLERMQNFRALLELESRTVAMAYTDLVRETRRLGGPFRQSAWRASPAESDEQFDQEDPGYRYENQPELDLCLMAMQRELRPYGPFLRGATRRRVLAQRRRREARSLAGQG